MSKFVRFLFVALVVGLCLIALLVGASHRANAAGMGVFIIRCNPSHFRAADPIVAPGVYPSAHEHVFFGSTSTNENSTFASMQASSSSCKDPQDTAGYWFPSLYYNGARVNPIFGFFYYQGNANTHPFPAGLKMVAGGVGDSHSFWDCFNSGHKQSTPPTCTGGSGDYLVLRLKFPECWDGVHLDSPDHRSHMAYATSGFTCPADHPVLLPRISGFNRYPSGMNGANVRLSDGTQQAHGDFWNTWQNGAQEALVNRCLHPMIQCGQVTG